MKASDLRSGNLVFESKLSKISRKKTGVKISTLTALDIHHLETFPLSKYYRPIPLTEEHLVKLGFKEISSSVFEIGYLKFKVVSHLYGIDFHFGNGGDHWIKPHFVHTLQNLYFALTGDELEYKK